MMNKSIFLPERIRVGYQERADTYTKRLAYVIYYDEKGKLRKEASWESWRNKSIEPDEFENKPISGFVLNKNAGGYAGYYGNFRQAYVRVYDPRGFEFEITIPNLLYILENCSSIKGKGLEGDFVYGWNGTELVLVPTSSPDYRDLKNLSEKRHERKRFRAKDLILGATYLSSSNHRYVYLGYFDYYTHCYLYDGKFFSTYARMNKYKEKMREVKPVNFAEYSYEYGTDEKRHMFYVRDDKNADTFVQLKSLSDIVDIVDESCAPDYAFLFDKMQSKTFFSPVDDSADVYTEYTPAELYDDITKNNRSTYWSLINDKLYRVYLYRHPPTSDKPETFYFNASTPNGWSIIELRYLIPDNYIHKDIGSWSKDKRSVDMSFEEVFSLLRVVHVDKYLKNGKFYKREG